MERSATDGPDPDADVRPELSLEFSLDPLTGVPEGVEPDRFADLTRFVLEQQSASGEWTVAVALVSDDHLQQLHLNFMGIDEPTDVMTFPYAIPGGEQGGDIVISVDHALIRGAEWGNSPADEIEFLMVHGLLHLLGWRDDDDVQRAEMLRQQEATIRAYYSAK